MAFTVELAFSGLGVVFIESPEERSRHPDYVELALLRAGGAHPHFPIFWFNLKDLAGPADMPFDLSVGADGEPIGILNLTDQRFAVGMEGPEETFYVNWAEDAGAVEPGRGASTDTMDWIPDLKSHFGLDPIVLPGDEGGEQLYATRVILPPGRLTSRHILRNPSFAPAKWNFGERGEGGAPRILAEQVVWSRSNVAALHLPIQGGLTFDAAMREAEGESDVRLSFAITNRPRNGVSGRFPAPEHFEHLQAIAPRSGAIRPVGRERSEEIGPITPGGACPPARKEIVHGTAR